MHGDIAGTGDDRSACRIELDAMIPAAGAIAAGAVDNNSARTSGVDLAGSVTSSSSANIHTIAAALVPAAATDAGEHDIAVGGGDVGGLDRYLN